MIRVTEQESRYNDIDKMSVSQILQNINAEDQTVAVSVQNALPQIEKLVSAVA
ncbi:MAG: N-acetylmuramic acid 6-phosphate etherase, partial [Sphingobacteriales bacterium]